MKVLNIIRRNLRAQHKDGNIEYDWLYLAEVLTPAGYKMYVEGTEEELFKLVSK